jgi:hypothetical protein
MNSSKNSEIVSLQRSSILNIISNGNDRSSLREDLHGQSEPLRRRSVFAQPNPATNLGHNSQGRLTTGNPGQSPSIVAFLRDKGSVQDPILTSMAIPYGKRSETDLIPIIDFIRGLRFFQLFNKNPETIKKVAQCLKLQIVQANDHVFYEGQIGDEFFIILDGEISIIKKSRISASIDFITRNAVLVKLSCGQTFGGNA